MLVLIVWLRPHKMNIITMNVCVCVCVWMKYCILHIACEVEKKKTQMFAGSLLRQTEIHLSSSSFIKCFGSRLMPECIFIKFNQLLMRFTFLFQLLPPLVFLTNSVFSLDEMHNLYLMSMDPKKKTQPHEWIVCLSMVWYDLVW